MKPYSQTSICVKCGDRGASVVFIPEKQDHFGNPATKMPEHLQRTCRTCEYTWKELPQDGSST